MNGIFENEAYINQLNNDTENFSKFVLFKEPRREIYEGDPLEIEKEFLCELTCCQELLLSRCRNYNKLMTKKKKKMKLNLQRTTKVSSLMIYVQIQKMKYNLMIEWIIKTA